MQFGTAKCSHCSAPTTVINGTTRNNNQFKLSFQVVPIFIDTWLREGIFLMFNISSIIAAFFFFFF